MRPSPSCRRALASVLYPKRLRTGPAQTRGSRGCCLGRAQAPGDEAGVHATFALAVGIDVPLEASWPWWGPTFLFCAGGLGRGSECCGACHVSQWNPFLALRDGERAVTGSVQPSMWDRCCGLLQHFSELSSCFSGPRTAVLMSLRPW